MNERINGLPQKRQAASKFLEEVTRISLCFFIAARLWITALTQQRAGDTLGAIVVHLTKKNVWVWVSGVCVVLIAAIGILVPPEEWGLPPWKWIIVCLIILAILGLTIQLLGQSKEDQYREEKEIARDRKQVTIETRLTEMTQLFDKSTQQAEAQVTPKPGEMQPPVYFDAAKYFMTAYQSAFTADVEKRVKIAASQNTQTCDPEEFYSQFIGIGLVAYLHDITWAYIWRSQFLMLIELSRNGGIMPLSGARSFYEKGAVEYPRNYKSYTFEQWLAFMLTQGLLIRHPSEMLEITVRGRDFLSYSAHNSRTADERTG